MTGMRTYVWNKIFSITLPLLGIFLISITTEKIAGWTMLLIGVSLLGYTHYLLGMYYQNRAWRSKKSYSWFVIYFIGVASLSVLLVVVAVQSGYLWLVALLTIPYFVWHGYENEQTLFLRSTNQTLSPWLIGGISLVTIGLTIDSFRHASAQFSTALTYPAFSLLPQQGSISGDAAQYLFTVAVSFIIAGLGCLLYSYYRRRSGATLGWVVTAIALGIWFWFASPLPYVWFFVLLLGYHFFTWGIYYAVVFRQNQRQFNSYITAHVLIIVGVVVGSFFVAQWVPQLPLGLLNTEFFITASLIHITTSFLNETWLKKILRLE